MLNAIYQWFETRIPVFQEQDPTRPPGTLLAFYRHFLDPVWPIFAVLLVITIFTTPGATFFTMGAKLV